MSSVNNKKVFVAMSGGVDSSVAALILKNRGLPAGRQGYDITGVFMRCYNINGCAEQDAEDARRVAEKLEIPFYVWDFEEEYKRCVVDYMIEGYRRGETPNPDVMCNREIKFGIFFERARAAGADFVATGHYVRLRNTKKYENAKNRKNKHSYIRKQFVFRSLSQARDLNKDQSYFLWTLTQEKLQHCLFPIGEYLKSEVRELARKAELPTAEKKDSQGICFLGKVTLADFLKVYIPEKRGVVLNLAGEKIGEHIGAHFYTIGQRQGIGNLKHQKGNRIHAPVYVAEKDVEKNVIIVAEGNDNSALYLSKATIVDMNLINPIPDVDSLTVFVRVRYRQPLFPATLHIPHSREWANMKSQSEIIAHLIFDSPQKFVASGQSAVFYSSNGRMLGGGVIL